MNFARRRRIHNVRSLRGHGCQRISLGRSSLERLESRRMLAISPLTWSDPSFSGVSANGVSSNASISGDGQLVAFTSTADDLVANDFNGASDVFLYNRATNDVSLISVNSSGTASGSNTSTSFQNSSAPMISEDGRFVVFVSQAVDLVEGYVPGFGGITNIYLRDLQSQTTYLVSANYAAANQGGAGPSDYPKISRDGSAILFRSNAADLVDGLGGGVGQLYAWDVQSRQIEMVSINSAGTGASSAIPDVENSISPDGRFVAFRSSATNLVNLDNNGIDQIYLRDRQLKTTTLVSIDYLGGVGGNGHSYVTPNAISDGGRFVTFYGNATNLVNAPVLGSAAYVRDMATGITSFVSLHTDGIQGREGTAPSITPDGTRVVFTSRANDLSPLDSNNRSDVYVRDLTEHQTILVSVNAAGTAAGAQPGGVFESRLPTAISPDGTIVAFHSMAIDLVGGKVDDQSTVDVFVRDLSTSVTRAVSNSIDGIHLGNANSYTAADPTYHLGLSMSRDGRFVAFESTASNLVFDDSNRRYDVYLGDVHEQTTELVTKLDAEFSLPRLGNFGGALRSVSRDGRFVAYTAEQGDVALGSDITPTESIPFPQITPFVYDRRTGVTQLVSKDATGGNCVNGSNPSLSADGRYVAFASFCDLVPGIAPAPGAAMVDVFVRDLWLESTELISINSSGTASANSTSGSQIDGSPTTLQISPDGRYVAFLSFAQDLVEGVTISGGLNIYVHDRHTHATYLVNQTLDGAQNVAGIFPDILGFSASSNRLLFTYQVSSGAMVANSTDTNDRVDVYAYNLTGSNKNQVELVSANPQGNAAAGISGTDAHPATISADGRYVAFSSSAPDVVPAAEANAWTQIYVRDLDTKTTTLVSAAVTGNVEANHSSSNPIISEDGRFVIFQSQFASNLTSLGGNARAQMYVRDLDSGVTTMLTTNAAGTAPGDSDSGNLINTFLTNPQLSPNGRYLAFESRATDLIDEFSPLTQANSTRAFYVYDFATATTSLIDYTNTGTFSTGQGAGTTPARVSPVVTDRGEIFFGSSSDQLIQKDRNHSADIFVYTHEGTASISGSVFDDLNNNGTRDLDEAGLAHWTVYVDANDNHQYDEGERIVQTDAAGNYRFVGLPSQAYSIRLRPRASYGLTTIDSYQIDLAAGEAASGFQFGVWQPNVDVAVQSVNAPRNANVGAALDFSFTVVNLGQDVAGSWQDAIYLSPEKTLTSDAILLATTAHDGGLASGGSYVTEVTTSLAAVPAGQYYVVAQTDRRFQIPGELARSNNVAAAATPLQVEIPELTLNEPFAGQFLTPGQAVYFRVDVEANEALTISLDSQANSGGVELYARFAQLPTAYQFDVSAREFNRADQQLAIPLTRPGTYYVLALSRFGAAAASPFTITPTLGGFEIQSLAPAIAANTGPVTFELHGTGFQADSIVRLKRGGASLAASSIMRPDTTTLYATFDLNGQATGVYDLELESHRATVVLSNAVTVESRRVDDALQVNLAAPAAVRAGRAAKLLIQYENTGNTNLVAPLLRVEATGAVFKLPSQPTYQGNSLSFLGISPDGPAGILRPGQRASIEIDFLNNSQLGVPVDVQVFTSDVDDAMDWTSFRATARPPEVTQEAWNALVSALETEIGTSLGEYQQRLADDATYLSTLGIYTPDTDRLFQLEYAAASGAFVADFLSIVDEAHLSAPGSDFIFTRMFQQSVFGRYADGIFGRGWTFNWDYGALRQTDGSVLVRNNAHRRLYVAQGDGSYASFTDGSSLASSGNSLVLTEANGSEIHFDTNGRLTHVVRPAGSRVDASYDIQGRLSALQVVNGPGVTFAYNADGHVSQLTDSDGHHITYSYDPAGNQLTAYTDRFGTHHYTYISGQGALQEHALAEISFSDDTHVQFTYDDLGRLVAENRDGGKERLSYSYLSQGGFAIADQSGNRSTYQFDDQLRLRSLIAPDGSETRYEYDELGRAIQTTTNEQIVSQTEYDEQGRLANVIDAYGHTTTFAYDSHGNVIYYTDARGNRTEFTYETNQLISTTYADGSSERLSYDELGNLMSISNRRGQTTTFNSDDNGRLSSKTNADGTVDTYEYDNAGRLIRASRAGQTILLDYNSLDTIRRITYANGSYLQFEYNTVGQRTRRVDNTGFEVNYSYDELGRLATLKDVGGAMLVSYVYDDDGLLTQRNNGNGTFTTYTYDAGQLIELANYAPGGALNSNYRYTYDGFGQRDSMTLLDADPATLDGTTHYTYDAAGQLIVVTLPDNQVIQYAYDAAGNRISETRAGTTTTYAADPLNAYTSIGDLRLNYDADGNLQAAASTDRTMNYEYDAENRLIRVSSDELEIAYTYNALGQRDTITRDGETTYLLLDPLNVWSVAAENDADGARLTSYVQSFEYGLVGQVDAAGQMSYYDFDASQNTVGMTDELGRYINRYSYLPFGETQIIAAGVANPFQFAGQFGVQAHGDGLLDMRFRNYSPASGQFVSPDPAGLSAGDPNLRRYVGNSPLNQTDPLGLDPSPAKDPCLNYGGNGLMALLCRIFGWDKTPPISIPTGKQLGDTPNAQSGAAGDNGGGVGANCAIVAPADPSKPNRPGAKQSIPTVGGFDPNDIVGPAGVGDAHYVAANQLLAYTIRFENLKTASAPAQEVFVTHPLEGTVDLATFELDQIGFGDLIVKVPRGLQHFATSIEYRNPDGSPLRVDLSAALDLETRTIVWTFTSVDPYTGSYPPGALDGFLPPNVTSPQGEGFVSYFVRPISGLPTGTRLEPAAAIVFDVNDAINTPPVFNTLDGGRPSSQVASLPTTTDTTSIDLLVSGADDVNGSGIAYFDIYASDNGSPYQLVVVSEPSGVAQFIGQPGHTYAFYSVAVDAVGNRELQPISADATTRISGGSAGDFDADGSLTAHDVDLLCTAVRNDNLDLRYDLNGDGEVTMLDHDYLIKVLAGSYYGDAELNGTFNSSDLVLVFLAGQYEDDLVDNSGWADGDWNCDGEFNSSDLVKAFVDGGYIAEAIRQVASDWQVAVAAAVASNRQRTKLLPEA
ncbi:MAG: PD40 domain-containing protein [Planctomycetales bacterium]|nr:PD40 domain-containing protein [Planctomycetales bacterium]